MKLKNMKNMKLRSQRTIFLYILEAVSESVGVSSQAVNEKVQKEIEMSDVKWESS